MTKVTFYYSAYILRGYEVSGHSGFDSEGEDIVCAAISSASQMTANTVTEILHLNAEVTAEDGYLKLMLSPEEAKGASAVLEGLKLHMTLLCEEFPQFINVQNSEV